MIKEFENRKAEAPVSEQFLKRWSPRAFSEQKIEEEKLQSVFEAARWSPSCFNAQPWLFLYETDGPDREKFNSLLVPANKVWAEKAPVLIFLATRKRFTHNDKPNRHNMFDGGAAWMSLTLQANELGLVTHAMAGIELEQAHEVLKLSPDDFDICCAIALGYRGEASTLPEKVREGEQPGDRLSLADIVQKGIQ